MKTNLDIAHRLQPIILHQLSKKHPLTYIRSGGDKTLLQASTQQLPNTGFPCFMLQVFPENSA